MIENAGKTPSLKDQLKTAGLFQRMDLLHEASEYDLLGLFEPGSEDCKKAVILFCLAGSIGRVANGYFFEKISADFLDKLGTEIIDSEGKTDAIVNRISYEEVHPLYQRKTLRENLDYSVKINTSPETVEFLWKLRKKLLKQLGEDPDAWKAYFLKGSSMEGEKLIDKPAIIEDIKQRIPGLFTNDQIRRLVNW